MANNLGYSIILSSRAQKERQQTLGDRFLQEILAKIKKIEQSPDRYPTVYKTYK